MRLENFGSREGCHRIPQLFWMRSCAIALAGLRLRRLVPGRREVVQISTPPERFAG